GFTGFDFGANSNDWNSESLRSRQLDHQKNLLDNGFYLDLRGIFFGNLIGDGAFLLQKYFGIIRFDPGSYYVTQAPVYLNWDYILALNSGTVVICLVVLLIPSYIITNISPVKAIRFE